jgi:hypothetical protein
MLVGGSNGNGKEHAKAALPSIPERAPRSHAGIPLKNKKPAHAAKDIDPKKLIPMDEGDFRDF